MYGGEVLTLVFNEKFKAVLPANQINQCQQKHLWEFPQKPWCYLHIDHAGPFLGKYFFILFDAYSKWLEVHIVNSTSFEVIIQNLHQIFSIHSLPEQIVSDNRPAFTSHEIKEYMKQCGIHHIRTSPCHPSSKGLMEHAVQTFKSSLKKL